jgi:PAS domain S-box-containing protein
MRIEQQLLVGDLLMLNPFHFEIKQSLDTALPFIPHGHCYLWNPELVSLHVLADTIIALSYYFIGLTLLHFVRKRLDLPFRAIFIFFSAFIIACGTTHWMSIWTLWHPTYWLAGTLKAVTALISAIAAIQLFPIIPLAISLRSPQELDQLNQQLEDEVASHQQTEAVLRESEARAQCAFENASIGMGLIALDGRWFKVNPALCQLLGYTEAELLTRRFQDLTHADDLATDLNFERQLLANEVPTYQMEKRYLHQDGHVVWGLLNVSLVRDQAQQPLYFISQVQAIDDRKQAEDRLRQSEARYRAIVEDQTDLICRFRPDGTVLFVNDSYCRYFDLSLTQVLGKTYEPMVYESDREIVSQRLQLMSWETPTITIENRVLAQGFVRWTQWNNRVIFDQEKQIVEFQAVGRDITQLKQTEAALRQSEHRYRTLINTIPQLAWVADASGINTLTYNQQWFDFTGQTPEEAQGKGWLAILHPDDRPLVLERWAVSATTGCDYEMEERLRRWDGTYIWHLGRGKPARNEQGQITQWYGTYTDISDRKRTEALREEQMQELQRLSDLKDDFLSTVSHELRAPVANIIMGIQMLDLILNQLTQLTMASEIAQKAHCYLKILRDEAQREISLLNDLLDLSRLQAGADPQLLTELDLVTWIPHLTEPFEARVHEQHQELQIQIAESLPSLTTDVAYLKRIFTELLHNACKYTPAGGTIAISIQSIAAGIQLQVCNSGIEIPASEYDRVFDKFYRIPNNDPWKYGGTGLGLALVKQMVEQLGGTIQVNSTANQTCFTLQIPSLRPNTMVFSP